MLSSMYAQHGPAVVLPFPYTLDTPEVQNNLFSYFFTVITPLFLLFFYRNKCILTRISTELKSISLYDCPGQPNSEISSLPGQKIPLPRPPGGGGLRVRRSSRKNSNFKISELKCIWSSGGDPWCFEHTRYIIYHVVSLVLHEVVVQKSPYSLLLDQPPVGGHGRSSEVIQTPCLTHIADVP